jgi:acyl-CoA synthetase (NDP forming)
VPSLRHAPGPIAVPADAVRAVLEECVATGVPGAVVISAGFREAELVELEINPLLAGTERMRSARRARRHRLRRAP